MLLINYLKLLVGLCCLPFLVAQTLSQVLINGGSSKQCCSRHRRGRESLWELKRSVLLMSVQIVEEKGVNMVSIFFFFLPFGVK